MIAAIVIGIAVGFVLAIPPGPIGLAAIRTGLKDGWGPSVRLAIGAGLFDVFYCALAMAATSVVADALLDVLTSSPAAYIVIQIAIVCVMILFGVYQFRQAPPIEADHEQVKRSNGRFSDWARRHGPFFVGVGFALANLANPTFVPALAAMATFIQQMQFFENILPNNMIFSLGFGLGNMLWLFSLASMVIRNKHRMTPTFVKRIQQVSGATLIGFGTFYGLRIIAVTEWTKIFV